MFISMLSLKFKLSPTLNENLCLVLHVFRENNVPDDVFWYMLRPIFKTNQTDIYTLHNKKMISIFEYDYKFNVIANCHCGYEQRRTVVDSMKNILKHTTKFVSSDYNFGVLQLVSYCDNEAQIYSLFRITNQHISPFIFCLKPKNINYDAIDDIIKHDAIQLYNYYMSKTNKKLKRVGITKTHLKKLTNFMFDKN